MKTALQDYDYPRLLINQVKLIISAKVGVVMFSCCPSVCLSVRSITQKVANEFLVKFLGVGCMVSYYQTF